MDNSTHEMDEKLLLYLDGELPENEKEEMERKLHNDPVLQERLENLRLSREAIRYYGLQQRVAAVHTEMMKEEMQKPVKKISGTRRIVRYSMAVAAGIILIFLGIGGYNFYQLTADKVIAGNYHSYELSTARDAGSLPTAIEKAYREKNYPAVIELAGHSSDKKEIFLAAMSDMELKNYSGAIEGYEKLIAQDKAAGTNLYKDEAEYYLSLAYIAHKDYDKGLVLLEQIKNDPAHLYHEQVSSRLVRQVKLLEWK